MLKRISQHYVGIQTRRTQKYSILSDIQKRNHSINFDVLYYAERQNYNDINEEIGEKEGEYIRKILPLLNTQIPKEENWRSFEVRPIDVE